MFVMLPEFEIAIKKAKEVNEKLKRPAIGFVPLSEIVEVVKEVSGFSKISTSFVDFSTLNYNSDQINMSDAGAMLSTLDDTNGKTAEIILNDSKSAPIQRFSMVHELGHLITDAPNYIYEMPNDEKFTISTLINTDITFITEEQCKNNSYDMAEQIANIFALLVLIPNEISIQKLVQEGIDKLIPKYGVTPDAIYSRMLISNYTVG